ncbi:hypothetical protein [Streptomyces sp. NPDC096324]|uniref:hypothetical protein n=1 Tax=Streptomyces sp. NPDC096324 TaxID=3366085 RepID=UPI0037FA0FEC
MQACLHRAGARAAAIARAAAPLDDTATAGRIAQLTGIAPAAVGQGLAGLHAVGLLLNDTGVPRPAVRAVVLGALSATPAAPVPALAAGGRHTTGRRDGR